MLFLFYGSIKLVPTQLKATEYHMLHASSAFKMISILKAKDDEHCSNGQSNIKRYYKFDINWYI
jgi:hypothetical protein